MTSHHELIGVQQVSQVPPETTSSANAVSHSTASSIIVRACRDHPASKMRQYFAPDGL